MQVRFKLWEGKESFVCWWVVDSLHTGAARVHNIEKLEEEIGTAHLNMNAMISYTKSEKNRNR
jgi:hypothetical protein